MQDLAVAATVVSVDVVSSSKGLRARHRSLDEALDGVLERAIQAAGAPREQWFSRVTGDSATIVALAGVPKAVVASEFVRRLEIELRAVNRPRRDDHRLRLRMAVAHGEVELHGNHINGPAVALATRLCDLERVRRESRASDHPLVLVVSEEFFRDVVVEEELDLDPAAFVGVTGTTKEGATIFGQLRRTTATAGPDTPSARTAPPSEPAGGPTVWTHIQEQNVEQGNGVNIDLRGHR